MKELQELIDEWEFHARQNDNRSIEASGRAVVYRQVIKDLQDLIESKPERPSKETIILD